jgi:hypothetical protein
MTRTVARPLRLLPGIVFTGDPRVWRAAVLLAVPLVSLISFYWLEPRAYNTGTDSVEVHGYVALAPPGRAVCVPGLFIPPGTARMRFKLAARTRERPALHLALQIAGGTLRSDLRPLNVRGGRVSVAIFPVPQLDARSSATPASACLTAGDVVNWGGTALPAPPAFSAPTLQRVPLAARIAVWYLPRASLVRLGWNGYWLYALLLLVVLPGLALTAVRCLALAAAGRPPRRPAAWLFAIAALNFACWGLITAPFQAPDETDHFAYTQSLVERGRAPSRDLAATLRRWSSAETLALEDIGWFTDHRALDSRPPWLEAQESDYRMQAAALHPRADDGGGAETAATHGPVYYAALVPGYWAAGSSPFSQLTMMRLASALIAALAVLFTFMLAREVAPGRLWIAVLAALLVAFQPMYGFISGAVNNDAGVNAAGAAVELLLIRMLRRGITVPSGALTGAVLLALPLIKGTGLSLYPIAAVALLAVLWRHHSRADVPGWVAFAACAVSLGLLSAYVLGGVHTASAPRGASAISSNASAVSGALHHVPDFLSYLWQVFLPKLPFMTAHFPASGYPAYTIFVVRGWGAFGSYTITFPHWVYVVILVAMLCAIPLSSLAAWCEWTWVRRNWLELFVLISMPVAVIVGFEAAYYTPGTRPVIAEVGRYAFPAIGPLAVLVVGALHGFGRRRMLSVGSGLLVAMIALSYASQLLTLTSFYA